MRLLVTGGFGFIGSAFVRLAIMRGHEIAVIDKMTYAADLANVSEEARSSIVISHLDIANKEQLEKFLDSHAAFDFIINFAAESHVDRSIVNGLPFVQSNITGVVNLLECLKKTPTTKLLQVSTDEVYGSITEGSWSETFPLNPRSAYSSSKASAELFCKAYENTHNSHVWITRCANNFGPRQSAEKLIPTVIRAILNHERVPVYGDGKNRREWIYVDDHAIAILKIIESNTTSSKIYNLGGTELSNIDLVNKILKIMRANLSDVNFVEDRKGHDFRYSVDDSLFEREFGEIMSSNFETHLESTVSWYLNNQDWLARSFLKVST
jgi:dTDP-glucose 4,6-dehydratase